MPGGQVKMCDIGKGMLLAPAHQLHDNRRNSHDHKHHHGELAKEMWQSVANRAVRMLAFGPFRSNFFSAIATVN
ncbi:hypothetical protein KIN20_030262 [Parelaphostrongylus tenuis]|uniref:Uncharacterized protein n=1 Tax=Parelaphostrongylus tenuis TaxID=148309 RepID=A0AAD5R3I1_PARTN|nr:hypothetical protein KIN20_030262 [Parelaphostrongylus tenuis]